MTTKKKGKVDDDLRIPCAAVNRIITVRRIDEKEHEEIIEKLRALVSNSKKATFSVMGYVSLVVMSTITKHEKAILLGALKGEKEKTIITATTVAYYNSVVEFYPAFRIEYICADFNGFMPEPSDEDGETPLPPQTQDVAASGASDAAFKNLIKKETSKGKKPKKYEFNTMQDIVDLKLFLRANLIGQDEAIETVCNAVKLRVVNFTKTVSLFFIGRSGVGKTELSRLLGEKYSGNFCLINCAEYGNGHEIPKLLGSPPGYIGHNDKSLLKQKADVSNKWVFLFDEIEKGHDKFFEFLLALLETGKVYDNLGNELDFTESIFIMTSNEGVRDIKTQTTNFNKSSYSEPAATKEELIKSISKKFSPEFRNRIDEFVFFNALSREHSEEIVKLRLKDLPVKRTPELVNFIVQNGFSEEFGARELTRFIKRNVAVPLADKILESKIPQDSTHLYEPVVVDNKVQIVNTIQLTANPE